ncbi:4091_t:CDS:2 [Entrophospora sp. SA101]|nr:4091_t:CDS:2 [Entrophospora sp. SA101]
MKRLSTVNPSSLNNIDEQLVLSANYHVEELLKIIFPNVNNGSNGNGDGDNVSLKNLTFISLDFLIAGFIPEHKYHVVELLQKRGLLVGMTGDGSSNSKKGKEIERVEETHYNLRPRRPGKNYKDGSSIQSNLVITDILVWPQW